jgi:hypothetical protein
MATKPSERVAVLGTIDPDVSTAAAYTSDYGDASKFEQLMAIVFAGTLGSSATLDAKLVQATSSAGANVKDITGKAITQLTEAGTDSDKQAILQVRADELDVAGGFSFVAVVVTVGTATSDAGAVLLGLNPTYGPASDYDLASVDEIVG